MVKKNLPPEPFIGQISIFPLISNISNVPFSCVLLPGKMGFTFRRIVSNAQYRENWYHLHVFRIICMDSHRCGYGNERNVKRCKEKCAMKWELKHFSKWNSVFICVFRRLHFGSRCRWYDHEHNGRQVRGGFWHRVHWPVALHSSLHILLFSRFS